MNLSKSEIKEIFLKLSQESGSHSPSIATLLREVSEIEIEVDACFLSNPYATDLFMSTLHEDLIKTGNLRSVLEFYPPQVHDVRKHISKATGLAAKNIFVGNGAIEVIQAIMHNFVTKNICVILPTFSSYYEFVNKDTEVFYYKLSKENNFKLNLEKYVTYIKDNKIQNLVIINPNNPDGGYINAEEFNYLMTSFKHLDNVILDESFIHFAYEDVELYQITSEELVQKYPNLIIIKSMSKDFGIAGIRAGYGVMAEEKVNMLLSNGYLWNVSGLANYFFEVYCKPEFQKEYDIVRKKYIMNTLMFLTEINNLKNLKAYPSKANFALVEILDGRSSFDFAMDLLIDHGVYVRDCQDKVGLEGQFLRIASRSFEENLKIIDAIKSA